MYKEDRMPLFRNKSGSNAALVEQNDSEVGMSSNSISSNNYCVSKNKPSAE
jgi:hypothetical protein